MSILFGLIGLLRRVLGEREGMEKGRDGERGVSGCGFDTLGLSAQPSTVLTSRCNCPMGHRNRESISTDTY